MHFLTKTTKDRHFCPKLLNAQQLNNLILWISNQEAQIKPKQQKTYIAFFPIILSMLKGLQLHAFNP